MKKYGFSLPKGGGKVLRRQEKLKKSKKPAKQIEKEVSKPIQDHVTTDA